MQRENTLIKNTPGLIFGTNASHRLEPGSTGIHLVFCGIINEQVPSYLVVIKSHSLCFSSLVIHAWNK